MALNIRSRETEALAAELARLTGETKTEAVTRAVRDRLERVKRIRRGRSLADEIAAIAQQCAALPVIDARDPEQILDYDADGLPRCSRLDWEPPGFARWIDCSQQQG